jgi:hypothetical protein
MNLIDQESYNDCILNKGTLIYMKIFSTNMQFSIELLNFYTHSGIGGSI